VKPVMGEAHCEIPTTQEAAETNSSVVSQQIPGK